MKLIIIVFFSLLLSNCASYSRKEFKKELIIIDQSNIEFLNGKYESRPFHFFGNQGNWNVKDSLVKRKHLGIYERFQNKSIQYDNIEILDYDYVNLNFNSNGNLIYELFLNDSIIKKDSINYKLKRGMVKLKNTFFKCEGLPFIFGCCRNGRIRIGLSKNKNLIINKFLILFRN